MSERLDELRARPREAKDPGSAAAVLHRDQATYMPPGGAGARGRRRAGGPRGAPPGVPPQPSWPGRKLAWSVVTFRRRRRGVAASVAPLPMRGSGSPSSR